MTKQELATMPIEAGWRALQMKLPQELSREASEVLRFVFFAGASRYRAMVRALFERMDDDERVRLLGHLTAEIDKWEHEDKPTLWEWAKRRDESPAAPA